ncbi:MAG: hypothetical protein QXE10_02140 [Desulfurococcaceae archaeon]|jgi:hypothetical protein
MNASTISKVGEFMSKFIELLSGFSGIGFWLFVVGFALLLLLVIVVVVKLLVVALKAIPNMTISQFIKFILALSIALIIVGIFMP